MAGKLKWLLGIVAALIAALVVAVYVVLSAYDFNNLKPRISKAAWDATGRKLTIGGEIDLEIGLTPALVLTDVKFQNAPWSADPELVKIRRFEVEVALLPLLRGNIEIRRFIVVEPDILLETNRDGKSNLAFERPEEKATPRKEASEGPGALPPLAFNMLEIRQGRLAYRDARSNETHTVMLNQLTAGATGLSSPVQLALNGEFDKTSFDITGALGPISALLDPGKPWPLDLTAKALGATAQINGSIKDPLTPSGIDVVIEIAIPNLGNLSDLAGRPIPFSQPFRLKARAADAGAKIYEVSDLEMTLGESDLKGSLHIDLARAPLFITAELSSKKLDFRPSASTAKKTDKGGGERIRPLEKTKRLIPDTPLQYEALTQVEGTAKIRTGPVLLPKFALDGLTADMAMRGGRLDVKGIKASVGGGVLNGEIAVHSQGGGLAMSAALKAEGLELGRMLKQLDITDVLEGDLDFEVKLKGRGGSAAALAADLEGHTSLTMGSGRINNKHIDLLGADLSAGLYRLFNPGAQETDYTSINCLACRFDIHNGLAESTVLVFDTELMGVVGEGSVDLATEKLDMSLKPVPKKGVGSDRLGRLSFSMGELTKPFKLGGTLAEPSLAVDPKQAAIALGKAVGGTLLFGPVGIATALVGGVSDAENPCLAAIEAAKTGVKPQGAQRAPKEESAAQKETGSTREGMENVGDALKNFFGR